MNTPIKIATAILYFLGLTLLIWATINVDRMFSIVTLIYAYVFFPEKADNKSDFCCGGNGHVGTCNSLVSVPLRDYWKLDPEPRKKKKTKSKTKGRKK